jgi:hypothetical protein
MDILKNARDYRHGREILLINGYTDVAEIEAILTDWFSPKTNVREKTMTPEDNFTYETK